MIQTICRFHCCLQVSVFWLQTLNQTDVFYYSKLSLLATFENRLKCLVCRWRRHDGLHPDVRINKTLKTAGAWPQKNTTYSNTITYSRAQQPLLRAYWLEHQHNLLTTDCFLFAIKKKTEEQANTRQNIHCNTWQRESRQHSYLSLSHSSISICIFPTSPSLSLYNAVSMLSLSLSQSPADETRVSQWISAEKVNQTCFFMWLWIFFKCMTKHNV